MTSVNAGSSRSSHASSARSAAEPKAEPKVESSPRREASAPAARPMQFRDEFVPSPSKGSGSTQAMRAMVDPPATCEAPPPPDQLSKELEPYRARMDEVARTLDSNPDLVTQEEREAAVRKEVENLCISPEHREEAVKYILSQMHGPVVHSPGKDQLAQGDGGPVMA